MRQRLTPEIVCSTTTRALEKIVLRNFSLTLNALPLGFFGVAWVGRLPAHTPESPCLCRAWRCVDTQSAPHPWPSYHGVFPATVGLRETPLRPGIEDVFLSVFLAVVFLLFGVILWTLAAAFAPVNRQVVIASACQITGRHTTGVALGPSPRGARPVARLAGADEIELLVWG